MLDQVANAIKGTILCTNLKIRKDMGSYHLPGLMMLNLRPKPSVTIPSYEFDRHGSLENYKVSKQARRRPMKLVRNQLQNEPISLVCAYLFNYHA